MLRWGTPMSSRPFLRLLAVLAVAGAVPACGNINKAHPAVPFTVRASVSTLGAQANQACDSPRISGNGRYVVYVSRADSLVASPTNGLQNVFRRDLLTRVTELVSVGFGGVPTDDDSHSPSISDDGRFVAFDSFATNLQSAPELMPQVYVRDMDATVGTGIVMVSEQSPGVSGDNVSQNPAISGDGQFIAFESLASNLGGSHPVPLSNIFRRDRNSTSILQISVNTAGGEPAAGPGPVPGSVKSSISRDGSRIAFVSGCTNLIAGDTNGQADVFVASVSSLGAVTIVRASMATTPAGPDAPSDNPSISADGHFVAFESGATNLVVPDGNLSALDIYVFNVDFPAIERDSVNSSGLQAATFDSRAPSLSDDGRYVAFDSTATNLVEGDTNQADDVFVRDRLAGITIRVSIDTSGNQAGVAQNSRQASISADGRSVAFRTLAAFEKGDTNGVPDIYVRSPLR
jgi:Tol biopolymer transport system component